MGNNRLEISFVGALFRDGVGGSKREPPKTILLPVDRQYERRNIGEWDRDRNKIKPSEVHSVNHCIPWLSLIPHSRSFLGYLSLEGALQTCAWSFWNETNFFLLSWILPFVYYYYEYYKIDLSLRYFNRIYYCIVL